MNGKVIAMIIIGIIIFTFIKCNNDQKILNSNIDTDILEVRDTITNKIVKDTSKNRIKKINNNTDTFLLGKWYATKFFFDTKIGAIGSNEAKAMLNKCLFNIDKNKIADYVKETGYSQKGEMVYYDTIKTESLTIDSLLNQDNNNIYKDTFKKILPERI